MLPPVILPVPNIQQHDHGECLAACAAMVLTYLGFPTAYRRLLKLLQIQPQVGTPAPNIRQLEILGLNVVYNTQGTLVELHDHLANNRPCITFVKTIELPYWGEAGDHAVVVVGLDDEHIYLNDPAFTTAPMQVSRGDFDLAWLGRDEFYAVLMRRD